MLPIKWGEREWWLMGDYTSSSQYWTLGSCDHIVGGGIGGKGRVGWRGFIPPPTSTEHGGLLTTVNWFTAMSDNQHVHMKLQNYFFLLIYSNISWRATEFSASCSQMFFLTPIVTGLVYVIETKLFYTGLLLCFNIHTFILDRITCQNICILNLF